MASTFKTLNAITDTVSTRNLLYEAIPLTGAIVSRSAPDAGAKSEGWIKNFSHGIFQSVYDYPYLSSSANHIFDLTAGYSSQSGLSASTSTENTKKINIYNEMSQVLVGFDENNIIRRFDADGDFYATGTKLNEIFVLNFTRLLTKDEVKKGSFTLGLGVSSSYAQPFGDGTTGGQIINLVDKSGSAGFKVNSPAGEYGILYATGSLLKDSLIDPEGYVPAGLLYYQAGIAIISASVFGTMLDSDNVPVLGFSASAAGATITGSLKDIAISGNCDILRHRIYNLSFNNTTELNSTIYFCRANHNEFNYSSNPTYLSDSKIVVKTDEQDLPVSYITTVGLYSADNELIAVAKLSEPLKKDSTNELTIRVRLDY